MLPDIIIQGINFPIPIDDDLSSQIQVDPFGGAIDGNGNYSEWLGFGKDDFQELLKTHGNKNNYGIKIEMNNVIQSFFRKDDFALISILYSDDKKQNLVRTVLAQIVCDKTYDVGIRNRSYAVLDKLDAINFNILKKWVTKISPEILNGES